MSIYFDGIHLLSDESLNELHAFAQRVGLKRVWFQAKRIPHYDVFGKMVKLVLAEHPQMISTRKELYEVIKKAKNL